MYFKFSKLYLTVVSVQFFSILVNWNWKCAFPNHSIKCVSVLNRMMMMVYRNIFRLRQGIRRTLTKIFYTMWLTIFDWKPSKVPQISSIAKEKSICKRKSVKWKSDQRIKWIRIACYCFAKLFNKFTILKSRDLL